jgi:predicted transcriptional regulator
MKTKTQKVLPKTTGEITNGGVYAQRVRCSKANCKCARGEHHTAFYFFTRRGGKLVKLYVRKAEVEAFSKLVEQASAERRCRRQTSKASAELLSKFSADLSKNDGLIKALRGEQDHE